MKKNQFILISMLGISVAVAWYINPSKAINQKKILKTNNSIPDNVAEVLRKSCVSCHDEGGKGMAKSMWNFSKWDTYSAEKQGKKANAICNAITKGTMPPSSVKKSTPEKIPTGTQIEIVCNWANTFNKK